VPTHIAGHHLGAGGLAKIANTARTPAALRRHAELRSPNPHHTIKSIKSLRCVPVHLHGTLLAGGMAECQPLPYKTLAVSPGRVNENQPFSDENGNKTCPATEW